MTTRSKLVSYSIISFCIPSYIYLKMVCDEPFVQMQYPTDYYKLMMHNYYGAGNIVVRHDGIECLKEKGYTFEKRREGSLSGKEIEMISLKFSKDQDLSYFLDDCKECNAKTTIQYENLFKIKSKMVYDWSKNN